MTPSVKRTPTTESLVELEGGRRAMYRTVVAKLLYMCQERADVMYSLKETARNFTCPTESDEMNLKRIVRNLKGAPSAKEPDRNHYTSEVREHVHRQRLGRASNNVQKHKWRSCAVVKRNTHSMVTNTANSKLEFCWSRIICPDDWSCQRNGDETSFARIGTWSNSHEPCWQSVCKSMGRQERTWKNETRDAEVQVCARRRGEEVDESCIH